MPRKRYGQGVSTLAARQHVMLRTAHFRPAAISLLATGAEPLRSTPARSPRSRRHTRAFASHTPFRVGRREFLERTVLAGAISVLHSIVFAFGAG